MGTSYHRWTNKEIEQLLRSRPVSDHVLAAKLKVSVKALRARRERLEKERRRLMKAPAQNAD